MIRNNGLRNIISDPEFWMLIVLNLWLAISYKFGKIGPSTIIFIYYCQSLLIGIFHFIRLLFYPDTGLGDKKSFPAWFFALHYGGFHFVYFIFLVVIMAGLKDVPDLNFSLMVLSGFVLNGFMSLLSLVKEDKMPDATPIAMLFFLPYLRIIPMHLFIMLGWKNLVSDDFDIRSYQFTFLIFIGLKSISDVLMYVLTHKTWRQKRPRVIGDYI